MDLFIKLNFIELIITYYLARIRHFIPAKLFKTRVEKFYLFLTLNIPYLKKKITAELDGYRLVAM
jgi:hypothetical protein